MPHGILVDESSKNIELTKSRDARVQRRLRTQLEESVIYLNFVRRLREEARRDLTLIDALVKQSKDELDAPGVHDEARIAARRRPTSEGHNRFVVYVDECGNHALNAKEAFSAFCLSAILVNEDDLEKFEQTWEGWKSEYLGSPTKRVHEPDIKDRSKSFWCGGDRDRQTAAINSLNSCIESLPFTGFVCILERKKFVDRFGKDTVDASLPRHTYLLTVNFLAERIALAIDKAMGGGKARWIIESRGPREDAAFQYEFARLFLDGTAYLSPHYFRALLQPGLTFKSKADSVPGLQVADLLARPCAEKIMRPETTPPRWEVFKPKLCSAVETRNSILGLKVLPWDDVYEDICKTKETT